MRNLPFKPPAFGPALRGATLAALIGAFTWASVPAPALAACSWYDIFCEETEEDVEETVSECSWYDLFCDDSSSSSASYEDDYSSTDSSDSVYYYDDEDCWYGCDDEGSSGTDTADSGYGDDGYGYDDEDCWPYECDSGTDTADSGYGNDGYGYDEDGDCWQGDCEPYDEVDEYYAGGEQFLERYRTQFRRQFGDKDPDDLSDSDWYNFLYEQSWNPREYRGSPALLDTELRLRLISMEIDDNLLSTPVLMVWQGGNPYLIATSSTTLGSYADDIRYISSRLTAGAEAVLDRAWHLSNRAKQAVRQCASSSVCVKRVLLKAGMRVAVAGSGVGTAFLVVEVAYYGVQKLDEYEVIDLDAFADNAMSVLGMANDSAGDETDENSGSSAPPLPDDLVGEQDKKSRKAGNRHISGPLAPANGGSGDAEEDFDKLTGGKSSPAPEDSTFPEGTLLGENGVIYRPDTDGSGPRIDIPENGSKPHETLHYPPN